MQLFTRNIKLIENTVLSKILNRMLPIENFLKNNEYF